MSRITEALSSANKQELGVGEEEEGVISEEKGVGGS
jgi:hypothetical protein